MSGYCDQCDRHCPLDALSCGRGYRKYGQANGGEQPERRPRRDDEGEHRRYNDRGPEGGRHHGDHGPEGGHRHHGDHGPEGGCRHRGEDGHPRRGPRPSPEQLRARIDGAELGELMEMSGHMLHHRPDGGAARGQARILGILAGREEISQRELTEMLRVQPGSVSEILTKLERKGLLTRERGEDRRGNLLRITPEGRDAAARLAAEPEEDLFSALKPEERATLTGLMRRLLADWAERFARGSREDGAETLPTGEEITRRYRV